MEKAIPTNYFAIVIFVCFTTKCHKERTLRTLLQKEAVKRVSVIEKEMDALLESRMKELSANDMEVWVFDTKRNAHVQKGRLEQEQQARRKEESILDLELDFLAPYFQRYI